MKNKKQYKAIILLVLFVCTISLQNASALTKKFSITPAALFAQKHGKLVNANDLCFNSSDESFYDTEDEDNLNVDIASLNFYQTFFEVLFPPKASQSFFISESVKCAVSTSLYLFICAIKI